MYRKVMFLGASRPASWRGSYWGGPQRPGEFGQVRASVHRGGRAEGGLGVFLRLDAICTEEDPEGMCDWAACLSRSQSLAFILAWPVLSLPGFLCWKVVWELLWFWSPVLSYLDVVASAENSWQHSVPRNKDPCS